MKCTSGLKVRVMERILTDVLNKEEIHVVKSTNLSLKSLQAKFSFSFHGVNSLTSTFLMKKKLVNGLAL